MICEYCHRGIIKNELGHVYFKDKGKLVNYHGECFEVESGIAVI